MLRNKAIKRFTSILLSIALLLNSCPLYALTDFEDEDKYGSEDIATIKQSYNAHLVTENKYLKLYETTTNLRLAEGHFGEQPDFYSSITPDGRLFTLEFLQEQSQDIRLEVWNEDDTVYKGLIAYGQADGQWGILHDTQWYTNNPIVSGTQKPVANYVEWDGRYWDNEQQIRVYPGQVGDEPPEMGKHVIHIAFQPTDPATAQYRTVIRVEIDYTLEAIINNMLLRTLYGLDCELDPVGMVNGNFSWDYTDLAVFGSQPLEFKRYYNALDDNKSEIGYGWRHNYMYFVEESGLTVTLNFPDGSRISYNIKGDGSMLGPAGKAVTLETDGNGYLMTDQTLTKHYFDGGGYLTAIEDLGGNRTEIVRNGDKISTVSNSSGMLTFTYSGDEISAITDQAGRSVSYTYDNGDLVSFRNADSDTINYTYDSHLITEISDFNGNTYLENTYDSLGRVIEQYLAGQGTSYFAYDFANKVSTITAPDGAVRKYYYDSKQNVTAVEDVLGTTSYSYEDGRIVTITDKLSQTTSYTYDENGNTISISYPDNTEELFEYNELNLVTKATARDTTEKLYGYDGQGNP